ncbi:MAG: RNB domain-containing ribonuclease [Clostridia bacterium]|nr:RNB domain-containing ribonuclease [Clostridia bacterium]
MNGTVNRIEHNEAFPKNVIEQAYAASRIRIANHLARRLDLRSKTVFTFGDTADEQTSCAFSVYPNGIGWQLGIHVADICEFVPEGSPIDIEARRRLAAVSNGFVKTEMLPEKLKELCTLTVGEDRLALSVLLDISSDGALQDITCEESIIRVAQHCVYSEVDQYGITADTSAVFALREKYAPIEKKLEALYNIAAMFYSQRISKGGIDLTVFRRVYDRDENGNITDIRLESEADLRAMVREIGYFVSKSLGELLHKKKIPAIYVGQQAVDRETLDFLATLVGVDKEYSNDFEYMYAVAENSKASPYYEFVCNAISAGLPCNSFSDKPINHVLCVSDKVVSFLSPTARYADILTQRMIKTAISAKYDAKNLNLNKKRREAQQAAEEATRTQEYLFEVARQIRNASIREYLENSNESSFVGFPIYKDESGSLLIIMECGLQAQVTAEDAKDFEFEPAKPYNFEIVAFGTETQPIILKPVE